LGDAAETAVVDWLAVKGFTIIERNWKTKYCEIDIVSEKDGVLYFVEVKYRSTKHYGGGIAAIDTKKLKKMRFAAELYQARNSTSQNVRLAAITVDKNGAIELFEVE
jgi:uncharacterized protein (TIGR00252 family)